MRFKPPECPDDQRQRLDGLMEHLEATRLDSDRYEAIYDVHLLTPLYGGGVTAGQPDPGMPIRAREVLYQLRFWWRVCKIAELTRENISEPWARLRGEEQSLFGWRSDRSCRVHTLIELQADSKQQYLSDWIQETNKGLKYILWPSMTEGKFCLIFPSDQTTCQLRLGLKNPTGEKEKQELFCALRWWASFGGLGARTRRGIGAVLVQDSEGKLLPPVTETEADAVADCALGISRPLFDDPISALSHGIQKLYDFRQGSLGRLSRFGVSTWPEADAIRRRAQHYLHEPRHRAGDLYPRAAFGLPIQFQFKDGVDPDEIKRNQGDPSRLMELEDKKEPATTTLTPEGRDRLASPLILRPRAEENGYRCIALRLSNTITQLDDLTLSLKETSESDSNYPLYKAARITPYWDNRQAANVHPIKRADQTDPLDAFLAYFSA